MSASVARAIDDAVEGQTVAGLLVRAVHDYTDQIAIRTLGDDPVRLTYAEFADRVARLAAGLASIGVGRGERVVLLMQNRAEFHICDLAVIMCGATPISIYNSSSVEQVVYLASDCAAKVAIVADDTFRTTIEAARPQVPALEEIVIIDASADTPAEVHRYDDLVASEPVDIAEASALVEGEDLATVIYTSGTTGPPKGVMLTHRNVCWMIESLRVAIGLDPRPWRTISALPMAHIAERMTSHYLMVAMGFEVTPLDDIARLATTLTTVRPNLIVQVPRVYEKINAAVMGVIDADAEQSTRFSEAIEAARPIVARRAWGTATDEDLATWDFLDSVAFARVRELVGLDQLELALTGAAPIAAELLEWYRALGVPLSEIYGMSESCAVTNWEPHRVKVGTVGPVVPGGECRIAEDGEILYRGGNVFAGYLGEPDKTAEAIDADGWLHTGDIGTLDDDGYLAITGRKKELIVTAGGKNISPANLEAAIATIPLVDQAVAIGDHRKFVSALVTLDADVATRWAAERGLPTDLAELARHDEVHAAIEAELAGVMQPFNHAEQIKRFTVLGDVWEPDSDVLTPTLKLKRRGVVERYGDVIDAMYE